MQCASEKGNRHSVLQRLRKLPLPLSRPAVEMHVVKMLVMQCNGVVPHRLCSLCLPSWPDSRSVSGEGQTLHVSHSAHYVLPNQRSTRAWSRVVEVTQE